MSDQNIVRATGLLVIEAINSNPNGDPDCEGDPRQRRDGKGEISPVSFKRKLRDLVEDKEGLVWKELKAKFDLKDEENMILESRGRNREEINKLLTDNFEAFKKRYWDARVFGNTFLEEAKAQRKLKKQENARVFGNTFLEEGSSTTIKTGVVQFGMGLSVAPIFIERQTNTSKSGVQEGKDRGMAPMGFRIVQHGIYCMPFFVNPSAASGNRSTGCTKTDIDLLLALIPLAYPHTRSYIRNNVEILNAWYIEHKSPLGSCPDYKLIDALTPKKRQDPDKPSMSRDEYDRPPSLPNDLESKIASIKDLMEF
ncbi:MAG: type I CRISPR-associated protein Cas7 [Planctomycetota bacterium]